MNTEQVPFAITIVSQIKDAGPFVGVIERYGKEVGRTWQAYGSMTEALFEAIKLEIRRKDDNDPHDYEPDTRKEIDDDREDSGKAELARVFLGGGE